MMEPIKELVDVDKSLEEIMHRPKSDFDTI